MILTKLDLRRDLKLRTPFYQRTSTYGHFGREGFPWEEPKELVLN